MRPIAGNAALRPDQNSSRCFSSFDTRISVAPASASTRVISAMSAATSSGVPSVSHQQHRRGVERVVGVHVLLDRAGGRLVHHLEAGGQDAGADDRADRGAGLGDVVERGERHLRELRLRRQLDRDLGGDGEQPLGAVDQREQVVAGGVQRVAAEFDDRRR